MYPKRSFQEPSIRGGNLYLLPSHSASSQNQPDLYDYPIPSSNLLSLQVCINRWPPRQHNVLTQQKCSYAQKAPRKRTMGFSLSCLPVLSPSISRLALIWCTLVHHFQPWVPSGQEWRTLQAKQTGCAKVHHVPQSRVAGLEGICGEWQQVGLKIDKGGDR